jgi:hypothetical protein
MLMINAASTPSRNARRNPANIALSPLAKLGYTNLHQGILESRRRIVKGFYRLLGVTPSA